MPRSYKHISAELAGRIKLVMTDVDGTIAAGGETPGEAVAVAIHSLEGARIGVGLVSGRTLPELEKIARDLAITGPVIAENGGVAKLNFDAGLLELGYSRQPALDALQTLRSLYPKSIRERADNRDRLIDVVIFGDGVKPSDMRRHIGDTQLVDSGYILHLMQAGISKGRTLTQLLERLPERELSAASLMVLGDSLTDLSLFEHFSNSVLVPNPLLDPRHRQELEHVVEYVTDTGVGDGFVQVARHLLSLR